MTFPNDGTCVIKIEYLEEKISAVLAESRQARKYEKAYIVKFEQYDREAGLGLLKAKRHRWKDSVEWRDRAQERPDERETTRASAEQDAMHRSGSRELLLRT